MIGELIPRGPGPPLCEVSRHHRRDRLAAGWRRRTSGQRLRPCPARNTRELGAQRRRRSAAPRTTAPPSGCAGRPGPPPRRRCQVAGGREHPGRLAGAVGLGRQARHALQAVAGRALDAPPRSTPAGAASKSARSRLHHAGGQAGRAGRGHRAAGEQQRAARGTPRARRAPPCWPAARRDRWPAAGRSRAEAAPAALPRPGSRPVSSLAAAADTSPEWADSSHEPMLIGEVGFATRSMCRNRSGRPSSMVRNAPPP